MITHVTNKFTIHLKRRKCDKLFKQVIKENIKDM